MGSEAALVGFANFQTDLATKLPTSLYIILKFSQSGNSVPNDWDFFQNYTLARCSPTAIHL